MSKVGWGQTSLQCHRAVRVVHIVRAVRPIIPVAVPVIEVVLAQSRVLPFVGEDRGGVVPDGEGDVYALLIREQPALREGLCRDRSLPGQRIPVKGLRAPSNL